MLTSLTRFIKNVVKVKIESILAIAAALIVLFTAMMEPYISFGIAITLLAALGIYKFVKRQKRENGYSKWLTNLKGGQQNEVS
jgi:predicted membrane protein